MYGDVSTTTNASDTAALAGFSTGLLIFVIALIAFSFLINWKIFTKAGREGWKGIIPFYSTYVLCEIVGLNGWMFLITLVPYVGSFFLLYLYFKLGQAFGKSTGFCVGLVLLSLVFLAILAFDSSVYQLAANATGYNPNHGFDPNTGAAIDTSNPGFDPNAGMNSDPNTGMNNDVNQNNNMM